MEQITHIKTMCNVQSLQYFTVVSMDEAFSVGIKYNHHDSMLTQLTYHIVTNTGLHGDQYL